MGLLLKLYAYTYIVVLLLNVMAALTIIGRNNIKFQ